MYNNCLYVYQDKFSMVWKSWLTNYQKFPRFLTHSTSVLVLSVILAEIKSYHSLKSILLMPISYVFCKKLVISLKWRRFRPRDKVCAWLSQSFEFPSIPLSCGYSLEMQLAADTSVRSRCSDIRKRMLNSLNKANYNRSTTLYTVNSWSVWWLTNILLVIRIIYYYILYYIIHRNRLIRIVDRKEK